MLFTESPTPCVKNPDLWFSRVGRDIKQAKQLCQACPKMLQCLEDALETESLMGQQMHGIHGGLTPEERLVTTLKRTG